MRVYACPTAARSRTSNEVFATGLNRPYGIAFYPPDADPQWVYVANTDGMVRFPYKNGDLKAGGKPETDRQGHPGQPSLDPRHRVLAGRQDALLSVGSGSNVANDMSPHAATKGGLEAWKKDAPLGAAWGTEERRAAVLAFDPDGKNERIFATGLRNCSGMTIQPATGELWCVVNERDGLGDNLPFDYVTHVKEGGFYGWPWYYIGGQRGPAPAGQAARAEGQGDRARRAVPGALRAAADRLLRGRHVSRRVQRQRLRDPARLVEPRPAHRLQGRAAADRRTASRPASTRTS